MSATTPVTEYANLALDELFRLVFVCREIEGDIGYDESVLQQQNSKCPDSRPASNQPFNSAASRFIGVSLLCRAVDIYNWYCRESLKLALSSNPKLVVEVIRKQKGEVAKTIVKADNKGKDAAAEVIRNFLSDRYRGEQIIRETVHCDLNVMQNPEVELLCICRNVLVHKLGYDEFGAIAAEIQKLGAERAFIGAQGFPSGHMPIALDAERHLVVDGALGLWAAELLQQHIFMMDQNFAHLYKLPRKIYERISIGRTFLGESKG